jgi:hypothetical protein
MKTQRRIDFNVNMGALHFDPKRTDGILVTIDPNTKFLKLDARLTRIGVFDYMDIDGHGWGELRTEDQVFDPASMRSFELATVTDDHPADFVSASNVKDVQVGTVGSDVRRDGDFLRATVVITDADVIQSIKDGKRELSCGYTAQIVVEQGVTDDGTPFAGRQTNIRGNHLAIVHQGRAGQDCALMLNRGDAFTITTPTLETVKMKTIKLLDGTEISVTTAVADAFLAAVKADKDGPVTKMLDVGIRADAIADAKDKGKKNPFGDDDDDDDKDDAAAKVKADADAKAAKDVADAAAAKAAAKPDSTALQAKVDMLETQAKTDADTFNARVDARSKLVADAVRVGVEATDSSDAALMRAIVLKVVPDMKAKLDAHKAEPGYLRCAYDSAMELASKRDAADLDSNTVIFEAMNQDGLSASFEDALSTYNDRATPGKA